MGGGRAAGKKRRHRGSDAGGAGSDNRGSKELRVKNFLYRGTSPIRKLQPPY
jgi:hypothetical protein